LNWKSKLWFNRLGLKRIPSWLNPERPLTQNQETIELTRPPKPGEPIRLFTESRADIHRFEGRVMPGVVAPPMISLKVVPERQLLRRPGLQTPEVHSGALRFRQSLQNAQIDDRNTSWYVPSNPGYL
jgi:hypothetical protein